MSTIIKTVKQYSYELDEQTLKELLFIANQYKNVKNYVYSRYSGINSILLLGKDRKIRDEWIKTKFYEQWKLPARYWKLALSEAFSNIKTNKYLFATSSGNLYGEHLNQYLSEETERLTKVNSNRNRIYAKYLIHLENGNDKKAKLIKENNLGKKKYFKAKHRHDENVKSYINFCLNNLLEQEKPKEIVMEQLDFVNWNDRFPKSVKRKLSRWIKGYIRERVEYKCSLNSIKCT